MHMQVHNCLKTSVCPEYEPGSNLDMHGKALVDLKEFVKHLYSQNGGWVGITMLIPLQISDLLHTMQAET